MLSDSGVSSAPEQLILPLGGQTPMMRNRLEANQRVYSIIRVVDLFDCRPPTPAVYSFSESGQVLSTHMIGSPFHQAHTFNLNSGDSGIKPIFHLLDIWSVGSTLVTEVSELQLLSPSHPGPSVEFFTLFSPTSDPHPSSHSHCCAGWGLDSGNRLGFHVMPICAYNRGEKRRTRTVQRFMI